LSTVIVR